MEVRSSLIFQSHQFQLQIIHLPQHCLIQSQNSGPFNSVLLTLTCKLSGISDRALFHPYFGMEPKILSLQKKHSSTEVWLFPWQRVCSDSCGGREKMWLRYQWFWESAFRENFPYQCCLLRNLCLSSLHTAADSEQGSAKKKWEHFSNTFFDSIIVSNTKLNWLSAYQLGSRMEWPSNKSGFLANTL